MPIKQIFAAYNHKENQDTNNFRYCPFCRTTLILQESGNRHRPTCPNCGFIHFKNPAPAVCILVVQADQVLMGKRISNVGGGRWALPSGYIEYDDDFIIAAIHEVKEETGLDVKIQSIVNVDSAFLSPQYHFLTIYLLARVVGGELCAGDDFEEAAWFPVTGPLPEMSFRQDPELIRAYAQGELVGVPIYQKE